MPERLIPNHRNVELESLSNLITLIPEKRYLWMGFENNTSFEIGEKDKIIVEVNVGSEGHDSMVRFTCTEVEFFHADSHLVFINEDSKLHAFQLDLSSTDPK